MADAPPTDALRGGFPDRYLTPDDVAELFRVPKETVYEWRKKRCGPPGFRVGKYLRYDPAAVRRWAEQQMRADAEAA
ncbi:helix-turn-helix domain-containing protein [Streptomyces sp. MST-110588]|uniref:helix-turn-helix domain-containing protein n=1 Tax=Streptomyces sp. MST-110588 TaxID=2833628 RepID=UPI001F5E0099|nr:helix-turn-helix domain-containing protein [Streptomyces sp. MST-110588]UNO42426.1 helix-turn-helix domain-containing protein [Streptomyces sp. MST-110588]